MTSFIPLLGAELGEASTIDVPGFRIPFSRLASREALCALAERLRHPQRPPEDGDILAWRAQFDRDLLAPKLRAALQRYSVNIVERSIKGVPVAEVRPADGETHPERVLIELHGGGFMLGGLIAGQGESVPIAATGRIKVVSVDYRQSPEHRFPAASEDVATVYRALLQTHRPADIGIFGTSAGGLLTAQAVAWFQQEGLPVPGAIGIFASGAGGWIDGDSGFWAAPLAGRTVPPVEADPGHRVVDYSDYFKGADIRDPLVAPVWWPDILARFPPTLLISGTRSVDLSPVLFTHRQLLRAGAMAELHVWEGMDHAFNTGTFTLGDFPETAEATDTIVRFFARHLGQRTG